MVSIKRLGIAGGSLFMFGIMFGWVMFPKMLKYSVHKQVNLKEGSQVRPMWAKFPFYLEFRIWLFNITNPEEIQKGAKPIVQEVGPYFFEEWQSKEGLEDREEDDTVEFSIKNKWIFRPDLSNGLTGDEVLTLPHLFILVMAMTAFREKASMVPVVNKAVNSIFKTPTSIFWQIRAMDYMFDGLPIDCTTKDFAASAVCNLLKENPDALMQDGPDKYKFSLLGVKNDTAPKPKLRVLRGVKKQNDVGIVVEYNGKPNASTWDDPYCDTFNGTDGTVFHPFFYENEDIVSWSPDICRSLGLQFQKKTKFAGLKTNRYTAFLGDPNSDPKQKCFCPAPDKCLKAGVMDLYKCVGAPLVLSHPHFYLADKEYLTMVDGLSPSQDNHELFLDFEPFTGSPLSARKRIQFNIMIHKLDKFKIMKTFPEAMLPLFWIEEGVDLPKYLISQIKMGHRAVKIVGILKWLMVLSGMGLGGFAGFKYYKTMQNSSKLKISKMSPNNVSNTGSGDKKISPLDIQNLQPARVPPSLD